MGYFSNIEEQFQLQADKKSDGIICVTKVTITEEVWPSN